MDAFGWNAIYSDGESLKRYNEDGSENSYNDIDRERLDRFEVTVLDKRVLSVFMERPSQKLVYRRRVFCDSQGNPKGMVLLAGWHENINGTSIKSIAYIYPDGHVELAGARDDLELVPCEE